MDKETGSLWFPMEVEGRKGLVGISGDYAGEFLEMKKMLSKLKWSEWLAAHPETRYVRD